MGHDLEREVSYPAVGGNRRFIEVARNSGETFRRTGSFLIGVCVCLLGVLLAGGIERSWPRSTDAEPVGRVQPNPSLPRSDKANSSKLPTAEARISLRYECLTNGALGIEWDEPNHSERFNIHQKEGDRWVSIGSVMAERIEKKYSLVDTSPPKTPATYRITQINVWGQEGWSIVVPPLSEPCQGRL